MNADWYSVSSEYWKRIPANINGVLGGFGYLTTVDLKHSKRFLKRVKQTHNSPKHLNCALDCGAGIGRVSKDLLIPLFNKVDMVEMSQCFVDQIYKYVGNTEKIGNLYCSSLQDFFPDKEKYDVIWIQWVALYLRDEDLIEFLKRCRLALTQNGVIFIKENISSSCSIIDDEDNSVTRTHSEFIELFKKSDLQVLIQENQKDFPEEIYKVKMFALQ